MSNDRMPHDREAERSLLGSMLRSKVARLDAPGLIRSDDFYVDAHRLIFETMIDLQNRNTPVDSITIAEALTRAGKLEEIGGPVYISDLWDAAPSAAHYRQYAEMIRAMATKRGAIHLGYELADFAFAPGETAADVLEFAEQQLLALLETRSTNETRHVGETVRETWDVLDRRRTRGGNTSGITSGFADLDRITVGFQPGELIVIAARPSVGKTAIEVNIARHVAIDSRTPMLFVSLEQTRVELTERLVACAGMIDGQRLKIGRLRADETQRALAAGDALTRSGLYIDDANNQTLLQLAANIRRMKRLHGIRLVMIDYLQLIVPDGRKENRQEQVASISRRLKLLARELQIPIIVAAQLNRETEKSGDGRPRLSDLRESGAIEQDADLVVLLHRPVDERGYSEGIVEAIVAKHRNGPTGVARLLYVKQQMRFEGYAMTGQEL